MSNEKIELFFSFIRNVIINSFVIFKHSTWIARGLSTYSISHLMLLFSHSAFGGRFSKSQLQQQQQKTAIFDRSLQKWQLIVWFFCFAATAPDRSRMCWDRITSTMCIRHRAKKRERLISWDIVGRRKSFNCACLFWQSEIQYRCLWCMGSK